MARRPVALVTIALIALLWVTAIVSAPTWTASVEAPVPASGHRTAALASAAIYAAGAFICHQRPERSFHLAGAQMPVCARCTGMYVGGLLGALGWLCFAGAGRTPSGRASRLVSSSIARRVLVLAAIPTILTIATAWLGLGEPGNPGRAILALPLGSSIGAVISAVASRDLR